VQLAYSNLCECLMPPAPVPFHVVRQVRCCILLADCLAGCLRVPGLCRRWLQHKETDSTRDATHAARSCSHWRRRLQEGENLGRRACKRMCVPAAGTCTKHSMQYRVRC
jgi:hypothetical protein